MKINFNDWYNIENSNDDEILDKFFKQKLEKTNGIKYPYMLILNKKSMTIIIDYLKENNLFDVIKWKSDNLFDVIAYNFFEYNDYIKIYFTYPSHKLIKAYDERDFIVLDFRK